MLFEFDSIRTITNITIYSFVNSNVNITISTFLNKSTYSKNIINNEVYNYFSQTEPRLTNLVLTFIKSKKSKFVIINISFDGLWYFSSEVQFNYAIGEFFNLKNYFILKNAC